jgi:protein-disulfide isomerase
MRNIAIVVGALIVAGIAGFVFWQHNNSSTPAPGMSMQATATNQPAAGATAGGTTNTAAAGATTNTAAAGGTTSTSAATNAPAAGGTTANAPAAASTAAFQQNADATQPPLYPDDNFLGNANAKVVVIEYASLSCPHCARFNADVFPEVKTNYIDKGLVKWVYRDYPLNNPAYLAAVLTHCASPMRYFGLVDKLFRSQDFWAASDNPPQALKQFALSEGVDEKTYDACLNDQALKDKIIARLKEASDKYKVDATPSFLIQGSLHSGEISYDDLKKLLDAALGAS